MYKFGSASHHQLAFFVYFGDLWLLFCITDGGIKSNHCSSLSLELGLTRNFAELPEAHFSALSALHSSFLPLFVKRHKHQHEIFVEDSELLGDLRLDDRLDAPPLKKLRNTNSIRGLWPCLCLLYMNEVVIMPCDGIYSRWTYLRGWNKLKIPAMPGAPKAMYWRARSVGCPTTMLSITANTLAAVQTEEANAIPERLSLTSSGFTSGTVYMTALASMKREMPLKHK